MLFEYNLYLIYIKIRNNNFRTIQDSKREFKEENSFSINYLQDVNNYDKLSNN
jgi:hypothetical protein